MSDTRERAESSGHRARGTRHGAREQGHAYRDQDVCRQVLGPFAAFLVPYCLTLACLGAQGSGSAFDGGRAFEHVRQLVAIGPRPAGSPGLAAARQYIAAELRKLGLKAEEQPFEPMTPLGAKAMVNVIARIKGARPERIILAGHYDTKLYREFRFVGANDGGSSAAFLLEMARVLKDRQNPFTIELLWLDGEEATLPDWGETGKDNTYGSRHYVAEAKRTGTLAGVKAMILVDMIGDRTLVLKRELNSTRWLTDLIWASAKEVGAGEFVQEATSIDDDHIAFLKAGVPAVDLIDLDYPPWHTAGDTLDQVSARSLETVGRVLLHALPKIEARLLAVK